MDDGTAVVLAASIPAICGLAGIVWQSRKTRRKNEEEAEATRQRGTAEHKRNADLLKAIDSKVDAHGVQLERIDGRIERIDGRVDRIDSRVNDIEKERPS